MPESSGFRRVFDIWNEVPLVPQTTGMSCWAAAAAMIYVGRPNDRDEAATAGASGRAEPIDRAAARQDWPIAI